jgi:hypothetical protein
MHLTQARIQLIELVKCLPNARILLVESVMHLTQGRIMCLPYACIYLVESVMRLTYVAINPIDLTLHLSESMGEIHQHPETAHSLLYLVTRQFIALIVIG